MPVDFARARELLRNFDLEPLFVEELGWDRCSQAVHVMVGEEEFDLNAFAEKRGMVALACEVPAGGQVPEYATRRKIERQVAKAHHEHLIVYADRDNQTQIWQWAKREIGKPTACREHPYHGAQPGTSLIEKLQAIAFLLDEEEGLSIVDVTSRVRAAFNVERVTKRFYDRFKDEHGRFLGFIRGIPDEHLQRWYASVMLNRLMFIYFIQKRGFLDENSDYLADRLQASRARGRDLFYKDFLCPLFFEGFARRPDDPSAETNALLGQVPYLNGGIFTRHQVEQLHGETIRIPDKAFKRLFGFFDEYQWHLDERPLRNDNEINPDVLGYIFEKYINQKQMGAYYTKEDITGYISRNTIIPRIMDMTRDRCRIAFEGEQSVWRLLRDDPDRYIYPAVRHGTDLDLPAEIEAGVHDVSQRGSWNEPAPETHALPTEIWREVVARRRHYQEVRDKLAEGDVQSIDDLVTLNLDICQFAQDVVENCEGPDLLRAFWRAIQEVTVLDPACGSGAFLFAALNILEPLYEACLGRMEAFVCDLDRLGEPHHPQQFKDFREALARVVQHPNADYFVFKSIIVNNLYGVDIMEEAVEICKLRLFLKLVAQIQRVEEIEPLPDIDFNIRAGNSLVGYATYEQVQRAVESTFDFDNAAERIERRAQEAAELFSLFRQQQTELGGEVTPEDKEALRGRLDKLENELNRHLSSEYGVDADAGAEFERWLATHKPFHWFVEFYDIGASGGFDVIIGNPPYLELGQISYAPRGFATDKARTVHGMFVERGIHLLGPAGCASMIVPLSIVSTQRMKLVQDTLEADGRAVWYANYSWRPGKLFDTVNRALTIFVVTPSEDARTYSTCYQKWTSSSRSLLMSRLRYARVPRERRAWWVPKVGCASEIGLLEKCVGFGKALGYFIVRQGPTIYYRTTGGLYWKVFTDFPPAFRVNGRAGHSTRETTFSVPDDAMVHPVIAILSSDLFWWWYTVTSNGRDLNPSDLQGFPVPEAALTDKKLSALGRRYLEDLSRNSFMLTRRQKQTGKTETQCFKVQASKPLIDEIDRALAPHYGFTEEELDFITNYDIKYRMGQNS